MLFLNPDSILATDALARMVEMFEHSATIGLVGGWLCNPDGSEQPGGGGSSPLLTVFSCGRLVFLA